MRAGCPPEFQHVTREVVDAVVEYCIPTRSGDSIVWKGVGLSWAEVRGFMQEACSCPGGSSGLVDDTWICPSCRRFKVPHCAIASSGDQGSCRFCSGTCLSSCPGCRRGIHFAGECGRWLHGIDRRYAPGPDTAAWLCSECTAALVLCIRSSATRPIFAFPCEHAATHMDSLISSVTPGAGANTVRSRVSGRALRRHLLELASDIRLTFLSRALHSALDRFVRHSSRSASNKNQFRRMIVHSLGALAREGRIWYVARHTAYCLRDTGQTTPRHHPPTVSADRDGAAGRLMSTCQVHWHAGRAMLKSQARTSRASGHRTCREHRSLEEWHVDKMNQSRHEIGDFMLI